MGPMTRSDRVADVDEAGMHCGRVAFLSTPRDDDAKVVGVGSSAHRLAHLTLWAGGHMARVEAQATRQGPFERARLSGSGINLADSSGNRAVFAAF
jgi:hypothetical protein